MASTEKLVMGFWLDNFTSVQALAPPSHPVGNVANSVARLVINKLNSNFALDPPLVLNDNDMGVAWIPGVPANTDFSTLDDKGLITLVQPTNEQTSLRVKSRLEEFQRADTKAVVVVPATIEPDSIATLRDELLGQIGPLMKKVDLQGKEIGQLKLTNIELKTSNAELKTSNAELKTSNAELKTSNAELKTSNAELKTSSAELKTNVNLLLTKANLQEEEIVGVKASNAELKVSNTELAATLIQHAKIIGSLRRRIVLDDARKKLTGDYPSQATITFRSEGFNNSVIQLHNALSQADSNLLSLDALQMIFDSSGNTIRSQGNIAAHDAPQGELAFSVLSVDVKGKQRELLRAIYKYAYSEDPEFTGKSLGELDV